MPTFKELNRELDNIDYSTYCHQLSNRLVDLASISARMGSGHIVGEDARDKALAVVKDLTHDWL